MRRTSARLWIIWHRRIDVRESDGRTKPPGSMRNLRPVARRSLRRRRGCVTLIGMSSLSGLICEDPNYEQGVGSRQNVGSVADRGSCRRSVCNDALACDATAAPDHSGRSFGRSGRHQSAGCRASRHAKGRRRRHHGARRAAQAALAVAKADLDRINSTRPETIAARQAELNAAKADETLAQETYNRQTELARTGNAPQARVDEVTRNLDTAIRKRESAEAALQLATTGASKEERALAAAQVKQAEATLSQRDVDVAEFTIRSPITGQVTARVAALGENFSAGAPLFSMIDMQNLWRSEE